MTKSTKIETERRIQKVSDLILDGYTRADIIQYGSNEKWGLSNRQIDEYIARATHLYESEVEVNREKNFKKHVKRFERLLKAAVRAGNLKVAVSIINSMAKLDGTVIERREINVSGNLSHKDVSDEDLEKLIQQEINKGKDGPTQ